MNCRRFIWNFFRLEVEQVKRNEQQDIISRLTPDDVIVNSDKDEILHVDELTAVSTDNNETAA